MCVCSLNEEPPFCCSFDGSEIKPIDASSGFEIFGSCSVFVNGRISDDKPTEFLM